VSLGLKIVHYVNQLFGGIGGEEKANVGPQVKDGVVGPGKATQDALKGRGEVVATVICGDNYFAEKTKEASEEVLRLLTPYKPDVVIAGPAFNAGRYGVACGEVCKVVQEKLGIPAVTGMYEENPGVDLYKKDVYVVRTSDSAIGMTQAISSMVRIALKLAAKEKIGKPAEEGYFPRGIIKTETSPKTATERAVDMLLAKLKGQSFESELTLPKFERIKPAPAIRNLSSAKIALVTDGGLVPKGNPDKLESRRATKFGSYSIKGLDTLSSKEYEAHHVGYDITFTNQDPNRMLPLDVMRDLEREGVIGKVHETFYTLAGVATPLADCKRLGQGIAEQLKAEGVAGVILTST